jgi:predicted amidophosphoribosyltransferase
MNLSFVVDITNTHMLTHYYLVDPYEKDFFFCILCQQELSNAYMHCIGCEELLDKEFNICITCYSDETKVKTNHTWDDDTNL